MALTNKQTIFIDAYLTCWNATEAARRAKYAFPNVEGPKNLVKPSIRPEIERRMSEMTMSANESLYRLGQHARANIGDFLNNEGKLDLKKVKQLGHLVKSFTWTKYGPKIELHDSQSAIVHIGRHHKLFTDKIELYSWQKELLDLLTQGAITSEDIENELGSDIAKEFFKSAGVHFAGVGTAQEAS